MSFKGGGSVATVPPLGKACVPVPRKVSVDVGLKQKETTRRCVVLRLVTGIFLVEIWNHHTTLWEREGVLFFFFFFFLVGLSLQSFYSQLGLKC